MNVFTDALKDAANQCFLSTPTTEARDHVATEIMEWLLDRAVKKQCTDLDIRVAKMKLRVERMAKNMVVKFDAGKFVVKATGADEDTLRMLRNGTDWFLPHPDVVSAIFSVLSDHR